MFQKSAIQSFHFITSKCLKILIYINILGNLARKKVGALAARVICLPLICQRARPTPLAINSSSYSPHIGLSWPISLEVKYLACDESILSRKTPEGNAFLERSIHDQTQIPTVQKKGRSPFKPLSQI